MKRQQMHVGDAWAEDISTHSKGALIQRVHEQRILALIQRVANKTLFDCSLHKPHTKCEFMNCK